MKKTQESKEITKKEKDLKTCQFCEEQYYAKNICPPCRKRDIHHGKSAPQGTCQMCLEKGLKLTKEWNDKYYCDDCREWNEEGEKAGIGIYCYRFRQSYCRNCGECVSCLKRKDLVNYSTRNLMIEVMERAEFEALLSWEDDSFKRRYGEIMWELEQVKHLSPQQIQKLVDDEVIRKKISQRKFSRGT